MVETPSMFLYSLGTNLKDSQDRILKLMHVLGDIQGAGIGTYRMTDFKNTDPIDFPYPSGQFLNVVIFAETYLSQEEVEAVFKEVELKHGRTEQCAIETPELIPIDIDLILWQFKVVKAKDLERPYIKEALEEFYITPKY